jgi:hypothetical protein
LKKLILREYLSYHVRVQIQWRHNREVCLFHRKQFWPRHNLSNIWLGQSLKEWIWMIFALLWFEWFVVPF